jgi:hypothetical protein
LENSLNEGRGKKKEVWFGDGDSNPISKQSTHRGWVLNPCRKKFEEIPSSYELQTSSF